MYKLYYAPRSASMGVRVILDEIGAPYELLDTSIETGEQRPPEQLEINPNGWVPVLSWESGAMYECAAITIFLCDRHPETRLAPRTDEPTRALYLQTLVYFSNSVQNAFQLTYYPDRFANSLPGERGAQLRGNRRLRETWSVVDRQVGRSEWVLGDRFSAADIYLFMLTTWLRPAKGHPAVEEFPNVNRVADLVAQRPTVRRVYEPWFANPDY